MIFKQPYQYCVKLLINLSLPSVCLYSMNNCIFITYFQSAAWNNFFKVLLLYFRYIRLYSMYSMYGDLKSSHTT